MHNLDVIQSRSCIALKPGVQLLLFAQRCIQQRNDDHQEEADAVEGPLDPLGLDQQGCDHQDRAGKHGRQPGWVADARRLFTDCTDSRNSGAQDCLSQRRDARLITVRATHHGDSLHRQAKKEARFTP